MEQTAVDPALRAGATESWELVHVLDDIEAAKEDWKTGRFGPVPEETEFIPLPQS